MPPGARSAALANSLVPLGKNPSEGVCRDGLLWLQAEPDATGLGADGKIAIGIPRPVHWGTVANHAAPGEGVVLHDGETAGLRVGRVSNP